MWAALTISGIKCYISRSEEGPRYNPGTPTNPIKFTMRRAVDDYSLLNICDLRY